MNNAKKSFFIQLGVVLLVTLAAQTFLFQKPDFSSPQALAASDELRGWAWSSNIGWVSMNCEDRGVCADSNYRVRIGPGPGPGSLNGYAWSSNIGWIDFAPAGPYPAAGPNWSARIDNPGAPSSQLSGWARALSNNIPNGGWDGWIKMSGSAGAGSYGVSVAGSEFSGFAWGGDVVGWLNFNNVTRSGGLPPACPTFTASPNTIIVSPGGSGATTLSWQCVNVSPNSCSIDQGIGPVSDSGSRQTTLSRTTTFTLSCSVGAGATAQTFVEVKVFLPNRTEVRP